MRSAAIGAGLLAMAANSAQAAQSCAKASDAAALRARMLQTELMVAALSCDQKDDYNSFVMHYRPQLKKSGTELKRYFDRSYGRHSSQELNSFITRLANEASKRSLSDIGKFCNDAKAAFATLKTMPSVQFTTFVAERSTADAHGMDVCDKPSTVVKEAALSGSKRTTTSNHAQKTSVTKTAKASSATTKSSQPTATKSASAKTTRTTKKAATSKIVAAKSSSATTAVLNKAQVAKKPAAPAAPDKTQVAKKPAATATQAKLTETAESTVRPKDCSPPKPSISPDAARVPDGG
jgi:hypothetical protein